MPTSGKHIDWALSVRLAGGHPELACEMLDMLARDLPEKLEALERARTAGDLEETREVIHAVRGAAAYCGVPGLHLATRLVEEAVRTGEPTLVTPELELLREEAEKLLAVWRRGGFSR